MNVKKRWGPAAVVSCLLLAATLIVYLQAINFELVHIEDVILYEEYSARLDAVGFPLLGIFHMPSNAVYMVPVSNFVGFFDTWLCGENIGMLHLMNAVAHAMNGILLFLILCAATGALRRSAFAAAIFVLHPVNTENVVSWCRGPTLIVSFFFMISFLVYFYYSRKPSLKRYALIVACLFLALMSKPSIIYLPLLLLLFDYWPLRRWCQDPQGSKKNLYAPASPSRLILEKTPLLLILASWLAVCLFVVRMGPPLPENAPQPVSYWYLFNMPVTYLIYLWKFIYPLNLPFYFPDVTEQPSMLPLWQVFFSATFIGVLTAAVFHWRKKSPFLFTGWLWFVLSLAPYVFICVNHQKLIMERYSYLPMIGLAMIISWGGAAALRKIGFSRIWIAVPALLLLFFYMGVTMIQAGHWSSKINYFRHAVSVDPDSAQIRSNLGEVLFNEGRVTEAVTQFNAALQINPDFAVAHNHLGLALIHQGELGQAYMHLQKAVQLAPDNAQAQNNLGNLLADQGNIEEAISHYRQALRIQPDSFRVHNNLATVLLEQGKYAEAIEHFEKALSLNPAYRLARENLAQVKKMQEKRRKQGAQP